MAEKKDPVRVQWQLLAVSLAKRTRSSVESGAAVDSRNPQGWVKANLHRRHGYQIAPVAFLPCRVPLQRRPPLSRERSQVLEAWGPHLPQTRGQRTKALSPPHLHLGGWVSTEDMPPLSPQKGVQASGIFSRWAVAAGPLAL